MHTCVIIHSFCMDFSEINRMQNGGALPAGQVKKPKVETTTNGSSILPLSESPVVSKPLPASGQLPPVASPETPVAPNPRPPPHQFRRPADVFDSKLYQPTKLSEKVFIPVKDYPKVSIKICIHTCRFYNVSPLLPHKYKMS